jgi:TonB family protein
MVLMLFQMARSRCSLWAAPAPLFNVWLLRALRCGALLLLPALAPCKLTAQTAPTSQSAPAPASQPAPMSSSAEEMPQPSSATSSKSQSAPASAAQASAITDDQLRRLLIGKDLFLRSGYLDNVLQFNERGVLIGHSPQGSFTLCAVRITKVRLLKHKVELQGERYGLHFLGPLTGEDPSTAVDRVNITPKKKTVRITIDREPVVKVKLPKQKKGKTQKGINKAAPRAGEPAPGSSKTSASFAVAAPNPNVDAPRPSGAEASAKIGAKSSARSQQRADEDLEAAIGNVFAPGLDARMIAAMPTCWKFYYQPDSWSQYPGIFRQGGVDSKARLLSAVNPASNQFAQEHGVVGIAEYQVVVGTDGKPEEVAVARPIGFGLDENAVAALRKATFEPAVKAGEPVPVRLNLVVEFRIYSKRTGEGSESAHQPASGAPSLPGPYSAQH